MRSARSSPSQRGPGGTKDDQSLTTDRRRSNLGQASFQRPCSNSMVAMRESVSASLGASWRLRSTSAKVCSKSPRALNAQALWAPGMGLQPNVWTERDGTVETLDCRRKPTAFFQGEPPAEMRLGHGRPQRDGRIVARHAFV